MYLCLLLLLFSSDSCHSPSLLLHLHPSCSGSYLNPLIWNNHLYSGPFSIYFLLYRLYSPPPPRPNDLKSVPEDNSYLNSLIQWWRPSEFLLTKWGWWKEISSSSKLQNMTFEILFRGNFKEQIWGLLQSYPTDGSQNFLSFWYILFYFLFIHIYQIPCPVRQWQKKTSVVYEILPGDTSLLSLH